jgi:hypothetical protein
MVWQCRLREKPARFNAEAGIRVGDMWFDDWKLAEDCPPAIRADLSVEYRRDWEGRRLPLIVAVPALSGSTGWRLVPIDEHYTRPGETHGWTVTGEPPRITVQPSINAVGDYHGWLIDGVLRDDVEGRRYPAMESR